MFAVEAFGTDFFTACTHPASGTNTETVILATSATILTTAMLRTIGSIVFIRTGDVTIGASPTGQAQALTGYVITLAAMFTMTFILAAGTIVTIRTGMLTGQTNIAGAADNLTGNVIAAGIILRRIRATFLAANAEEAMRTRLRTVNASPASRTDATSTIGIAGRVVQASANLITIFTIIANGTIGFAMYTSPTLLADTLPARRITGDRIVRITFALQLAAETKSERLTLLIALLTHPTGRASARAILWITAGVIVAITLEFTIFTIRIQIARTIAFDIPPTGGAAALTRLM